MSQINGVGLLGGGAQADEIESYLTGGAQALFRAVSKEYVTGTDFIDIDSPGECVNSTVLVAVGAPALRRTMVNKWPGALYGTVVAEKTSVDPSAKINQGCVIAPGVVITTNVVLEEHVLVNIAASISHDCRIGRYTVISPGVHIAGNAELGEGVFVGIGATISNNVKIAAGCVIGAGAVVLDDVDVENSVVVGLPARAIKVNKDWLGEV